MKQTVYLNEKKAIILEDAGYGSRSNAWIVDVAKDGRVVFENPEDQGPQRLTDLLDELNTIETRKELRLVA